VKILIISNQKKVEESFYPLKKSGYEIEKSCKENYKKYVKNLSGPVIVYFDIYQNSEKEYWEHIKSLLKQQIIFLGIIDSKSVAPDPAAFFHAGISDYIGNKQLLEGITKKRIKDIFALKEKVNFLPHNMTETENKNEKSQKLLPVLAKKEFSAKLVPNGEWKKIKNGEEYVFYFLYAEIDLAADWKRKTGQSILQKVKEVFHNYIEQHIKPINGKIWMWNEFGGLILFPYTKNDHDVAITASKLIVNAPIASCEDFPFKMEISYRLALHVGETVYKERGNTGTIVSDTINFTFHLGQKFAKPDNFYITEEVYNRIHPGLKELFLSEGVFENRNILRLRKFV